MPITDHRLGDQLLGVDNCPHCGVSSPLLARMWKSTGHLPRTDGGDTRTWAIFSCTSCSSLVSVECDPDETVINPHVCAMYPTIWVADENIPDRAKNYLNQAMRALATPDASVVVADPVFLDMELS